MTPLERAARALYQSAPHDFDPNQMGEDATWPDLVGQARAVLQAIRDPSERMDEASDHLIVLRGTAVQGVSIWRAMIDAALEEG